MKKGDLVRAKLAHNMRGVVVSVCEEVVPTIDILIGYKVIHDQRVEWFEVISESR